ncbi:MAG: hypothetical protein WBQ72_03755 [Terriglobales bacterium]
MNRIPSARVGRSRTFALLFAAIILNPTVPLGQSANPGSGYKENTGPMANEQGYVNLRSLQSINSLPSIQITSLEEAETYVKQVAELCGVQGPILTGELLPRVVQGELAAAQDPSKLVPDDRVAEAFNFLSDEFQVPHPQRLTGTDVLQFRITMAAIYPNVFSPKNAGGVRPVGALILLHQLLFNGGVPEGAKKFAQKDPQPGSFKVDRSRSRVAIDKSPNLIAREYRTASATYFQRLTSEKMQSFVDSIAKIMAFPAGR